MKIMNTPTNLGIESIRAMKTKLGVYPPALTTAIRTLAQIIGQSNLGNITLLDPTPHQLGFGIYILSNHRPRR